MNTSKHYLTRKIHRYLGVIIGIQFLLWTIGGLYFSWTDIDDMHGDHLRSGSAHAQLVLKNASLSPSQILERLPGGLKPAEVMSVQVGNIFGHPFYFLKSHGGKTWVLDASTGKQRAPINETEAKALAKKVLAANSVISTARYLNKDLDPHHEFRGGPMPAWTVDFSSPNCTVYINAGTGKVESIRHNAWRTFDFLWMLHTMDYEGRDNFNNWVLRIFSVLGIFTILSGFYLFFLSSKTFKKVKKRPL